MGIFGGVIDGGGSSRLRNNSLGASSPPAAFGRSLVAFCGDSIMAGQVADLTYAGRAQMATSSAYGFIAHHGFAVAGVSPDHMNATLTSLSGLTTTTYLAGSYLQNTIAGSPDVAFVLIGTNDCNTAVAVATITANLTTIYTQLVSAGIYVVSCLLLPNSTSASISNSVQAVNDFIRKYWVDKAGGESLDTYTPAANTLAAIASNSPWQTNANTDSLHPAYFGSYLIGSSPQMVECLRRLFPRYIQSTSANQTLTAKQLLPNPLMIGTGGSNGANSSGSVATNWQLQTTAASVVTVGSKGTANSGVGEKQIISITATAAPSLTKAQMVANGATFMAGESYKLSARIKVLSCSAVTSTNGIQMIELAVAGGGITQSQWPAVNAISTTAGLAVGTEFIAACTPRFIAAGGSTNPLINISCIGTFTAVVEVELIRVDALGVLPV